MARTAVENIQQITALGVVAPPPIHVQSPAFEGTLATLFRCVKEHKVDLMQVPLEPICEAYFNYLVADPNTNLDEAAAALTVLAYLLERKAWALLPVEESDEPLFDEPMGLPDPTTYEYADIMLALSASHEERSKLFFRTTGPNPDLYEVPFSIGDVTVGDLARAFERLLRKAEPDTVELLSKPKKSIQEQMKIVLLALTSEFRPIDKLFVGSYTRNDAVYWFLALLELIRIHRAAVKLDGEEVLFAKQ